MFAFALSLMMTPVMTRVYRPDDYGTFSVVNNFATFLAALALFSLPNALPRSGFGHKKVQILRSLVHLTLVASLIAAFSVCTYLVFDSSDLDSEVLFAYGAIPLLITALMLHKVVQGWLIANGTFKQLALSRVMHPLASRPPAIVIAAALGPHPLYLIAFESLGYITQVVCMLVRIERSVFSVPRVWALRRLKTTAEVIRRNKDISLYDNLCNLFLLGSLSAQSFIVANEFSIEDAGYFSLALAMVSLPIALVSLSTAPVIYHKLVVTSLEEPNRVFDTIGKIVAAYFIIGIVPYVLLVLYGADLFDIAFGSEWRTSGEIAGILAAPLFLQFILSPTVAIFRVTHSVKQNFVIDSMFLSASLAVFLMASNTMEFRHAVLVLAISLTIYRLLLLVACLRTAWVWSNRHQVGRLWR